MKTLLSLLSACFLLVSCNLFSNYGKKATIGKSEVYYKGEGITEKQAGAVGKFLLKKEWFSDETPASAQLTKEDGIYTVRLVVADPENIPASSRMFMWMYEHEMSEELFDGEDSRFVFADSKFNDLDVLEPIDKISVGKSSVYYDNSEYKKRQAQKLADFLEGKEYLGEAKEVDVFLMMQNEKPVVRLVVNKEAVEKSEEEVMPTFSYWQSQIQEEVLNDKKLKIILADTKMNDFKTVPKLTEEDRAKQEQQTTTTTTLDSISTQTKVSGIERIRD